MGASKAEAGYRKAGGCHNVGRQHGGGARPRMSIKVARLLEQRRHGSQGESS